MSVVTKRIKIEPDLVDAGEMRVEIPRRGGPSPSSRTISISGVTKIQHIIQIHSSNYVPGKISFSSDEEEEET